MIVIKNFELKHRAERSSRSSPAVLEERRRLGITHDDNNSPEFMLMSILVKMGANIDYTDGVGMTPLLNACKNGNMKLAIALVKAGANINVRDDFGDTPLHWACKNNNMELAMALVERGADINARNRRGVDPLHDLNWEYKNRLRTLVNRRVQNTIGSLVDRTCLLYTSPSPRDS